MIRAWRIDKAKRTKAESFSGEGARRYPGRWNSKGKLAVYAAWTLSLAALEKFVHMGEDGGKIKLVSYAIDIPEDVGVVKWTLADLPDDWRALPAPPSTQAKGDHWVDGRKSAVLILPSVVTPTEFNVLLNPLHPDFKRIRISDPAPYVYDPRMWR